MFGHTHYYWSHRKSVVVRLHAEPLRRSANFFPLDALINVSAEIDGYPSLRFQDIRKKNSVADGHTDGQTDERTHENSIPHPHKQIFPPILQMI